MMTKRKRRIGYRILLRVLISGSRPGPGVGIKILIMLMRWTNYSWKEPSCEKSLFCTAVFLDKFSDLNLNHTYRSCTRHEGETTMSY